MADVKRGRPAKLGRSRPISFRLSDGELERFDRQRGSLSRVDYLVMMLDLNEPSGTKGGATALVPIGPAAYEAVERAAVEDDAKEACEGDASIRALHAAAGLKTLECKHGLFVEGSECGVCPDPRDDRPTESTWRPRAPESVAERMRRLG